MQWSEVPIIECGQPLQRAEQADLGGRVFCRPVYFEADHHGAIEDIWLRKGVLALLGEAASLLPPGRSHVLLDGWRPFELQQTLFEDIRSRITETSSLTGEQLNQRVGRFVSLPSLDPYCPSPHFTGGAVDLALGDAYGDPLPMGGEFDELTDRSRTNYYESHSSRFMHFRDNRRLLLAVMTHVGFSNYPEEWWHFDVGNQCHHCRVGGPARFGLLRELPA